MPPSTAFARLGPAALLVALAATGCVAAPNAELSVRAGGTKTRAATSSPAQAAAGATTDGAGAASSAATTAPTARAATAPVTAREGARLLAADATIEALIPPGALDHDARVRITRRPAPEAQAAEPPLASFTADLGGARLADGARIRVRVSLDDAATARAAGLALPADGHGRPQVEITLEGPALRPVDPPGSGLRVEVSGNVVTAFRLAGAVAPASAVTPVATLPPGNGTLALPSAAPGWWMPAPRPTPTPEPTPTPTPTPPATAPAAPAAAPILPAASPTPGAIPTMNPAAIMPAPPRPTVRPPSGTLTDVTVIGRSATLLIRDYGAEDGDRVQVLLNGVVVPGGTDIMLTEMGRTLPLTLEAGENRLRLVALGTGSTGPNTLEVTLTDVAVRTGEGRQIGEALLTGEALTWRLLAE